MTLDELNELPFEEAVNTLALCCGSQRWAEEMATSRAFDSTEEIFAEAERIWWDLDREDWLEAFSHHPKIGDLESLREKFASTAKWAEGEQKGAQAASEEVLKRLAVRNEEYLERFGYIFIVCATGKSAEEMLAILESRIGNDEDEELRIAAGEQAKITEIRIRKLLT